MTLSDRSCRAIAAANHCCLQGPGLTDGNTPYQYADACVGYCCTAVCPPLTPAPASAVAGTRAPSTPAPGPPGPLTATALLHVTGTGMDGDVAWWAGQPFNVSVFYRIGDGLGNMVVAVTLQQTGVNTGILIGHGAAVIYIQEEGVAIVTVAADPGVAFPLPSGGYTLTAFVHAAGDDSIINAVVVESRDVTYVAVTAASSDSSPEARETTGPTDLESNIGGGAGGEPDGPAGSTIAVVLIVVVLLGALAVLVGLRRRRRRQRAEGASGHPGKGTAHSRITNGSNSELVLNQMYTTADMERSLAAAAGASAAAAAPPARAPHESMRPRAGTQSIGGGHLQTSSTDSSPPAAGTDAVYDGAQPEYAVVDPAAYDGTAGQEYAAINYAQVRQLRR